MKPYPPLLTLWSAILLVPATFTAASLYAQTQDSNGKDAASLRAQGDTKDDAGDKQGALELYFKARDLRPDEPNIYTRIANIALDLGKKEVGLEAITKLESLRAEAAKDTRVQGVKKKLQALPDSPGNNDPPIDPQLQTALSTVDALLKDALATDDRMTQHRLGDICRDKLSPWLASAAPTVYAMHGFSADSSPTLARRSVKFVWPCAARVALVQEDPDLAAFSFAAIVILWPDYWKDESLRKLVVELNKMPIDQKTSEVLACWTNVLCGIGTDISADDPGRRLSAAENLLNGKNLPKWYRGGIKTLEELNELPEPPRRNTPEWDQKFVLQHDQELAQMGEAMYMDTRKKAAIDLATIHALGLFDITKDEFQAEKLLRLYARRAYASGDSPPESIVGDKWSPLKYPPSPDLSFARAAAEIAYANWNSHAIPFLELKLKLPQDLEASLRWLKKSLQSWKDYKAQNTDVPIDQMLLECVRNVSIDYMENGKEERPPEELLQALEVVNTTLPLCKPARDHDTDSISILKNLQQRTYWNLGVFEWQGKHGPKNKTKAISWWKEAARAGYEPAQKELREQKEKW